MASILNKLEELAKNNGFILTENANKIANAKLMFFGENDWQKCPCDKNNSDRFCCSQLCQTDIRVNGTCHCHLFKVK